MCIQIMFPVLRFSVCWFIGRGIFPSFAHPHTCSASVLVSPALFPVFYTVNQFLACSLVQSQTPVPHSLHYFSLTVALVFSLVFVGSSCSCLFCSAQCSVMSFACTTLGFLYLVPPAPLHSTIIYILSDLVFTCISDDPITTGQLIHIAPCYTCLYYASRADHFQILLLTT